MALDYAEGDTLYAADVDNIIEAAEKNGVLTGWGVVENGTPNMSVNVQLGTGFAGGTYRTTVGDTNVVITASHATLNRIDLIVVNNSGTFSAVAGTPAATPNPPDLPDNSIILATVYVGATVTTILNANITQKGILLGTIAKEMVSTDIALRTQAQTVTGNWIHSGTVIFQAGVTFQAAAPVTHAGTVNFQDVLTLESAKAIQFCYSGSTVVGTIYASSATGIRVTAETTWGSGYKIQLGDGVDICGKLHGGSGFFMIKDADDNVAFQCKAVDGPTAITGEGASIILASTSLNAVQTLIEATTSAGGHHPDGVEVGGLGGVGAEWYTSRSRQVLYGAGGHGAYSSQEDLKDLRAIKEYRDDKGKPIKTTEHGDPVWDARTFPEYLRDKEHLDFRSKRQVIKSKLPPKSNFTKREFPPKPDKILEVAPEMAYFNVGYIQGWFISILKKLDEEIQEIKAALGK